MQLSVLLLTLALAALQNLPPMRARLAPVPIDLAMQEAIAGSGAATATLAGTTLTVEGTYRDLRSAATSVRLFESARMGTRGPQIAEFPSGGGMNGTFRGTATLTRDQVAAFGKGLLFVQVQSEKAPDGNLWGWLVAPKGRR